MYYKNYWINYIGFGDVFACAICNKNMTDFKNTEFDKDYMHIIKTFPINRYEWEHAEDYLDENGLFMGIFPLDIVNKSIYEWNEEQEAFKKEMEDELKEDCKYPINERFFEELSVDNRPLVEAIIYINASNRLSKKYWNIEFPIEKYYKDILIKYWGDYKCE